jgi:hypothetical protein
MNPIPQNALCTYFISLILTGICFSAAGFAIGWSLGIRKGVAITKEHMMYFARLFQKLHSVSDSTDQVLKVIAEAATTSGNSCEAPKK